MKKIACLLTAYVLLHSALHATASPYPFQVKTTGTGSQAIVFIPGFSCSGDVWEKTVAAFSGTHTCYVLTMAGFAGVPAQDSCSFALWEKGIAAYITDMKLNKPIVIGHSMGAGLAMALAADYPELVGSAVLVDGLPCLAGLMNPNFRSEPNKDCTPLVKQMTEMTDQDFLDMQNKGITRMLADTTKKSMVVGWSVASDRKTFAKMFCDFTNTDLRDRIATVRCPVLVLLESYFVNLKTGIEGQFSKMKTAKFEYAQKGLHFIMYDDSEWFLQQLHQFIKS